MKIRLKLSKVKIGKRVSVGDNFSLKTRLQKPKDDDAPRRYKFELRANDKKKYRLYSAQVSPGTVHLQFAEVK